MNEIRVKADFDNIEEITAFVDEYLEAHDCPMKAQMQMDIVIDELASNVVRYAYGEGQGDILVKADMDEQTLTLSLTFEDWGVPFDPLQKEDPDLAEIAEKKTEGGLGIFMVRKMTDGLSYEYKDGKNILTVKKNLA